jgi:hypothetical protein
MRNHPKNREDKYMYAGIPSYMLVEIIYRKRVLLSFLELTIHSDARTTNQEASLVK